MKVAEDEVQMGICDNVDEALQGMRKDTTVEPAPTDEMPFPDQPDGEGQYIAVPEDADYDAAVAAGVDFPIQEDDSNDDEYPFS